MQRSDRDPESTLYISNIPIGTDGEALKDLFSKVGDVKDVYLPRDHRTHQQRGFAYVEMTNKDDADKCLQDLQGAKFMDVELNLAFAKGRRKNAEQMQARNRFGQRGYGDRPRGDFRRRDDMPREDRDFRDRPIRDSQQERHFPRKRHYEDFGEPVPRNMDYPAMPTQGRYEAPYGDRTYGGRPDPRYRDMPTTSYGNPGRDFGGRLENAYQPRQGDFRGRYEPSNGERYVEYRNEGYGNAISGYGDRSRNDARRGDRFEKPEFRQERPSARGGHIGRDFRRNEGHNMEMNGRPRHSYEPMQPEMPRDVRGQDHQRQDAAMYYRKDRRPRSGSPPAKRNRFNNREDIM